MEKLKDKVTENLFEIYFLAKIIEVCGSNPEFKREIEGDNMVYAEISCGRIIGKKARELLEELSE